jgi:CheY-like chemotaxis protein
MDVQMPYMDGLSATRKIREQEEATGSGRIRIIALTANAMEEHRRECLEAGMDDYLSKPIDFAQLQRRLSTLTPHAPPAPLPASPAQIPERQLDRGALLRNCANHEDLARRVLREVIRLTPERLAALDAAAAAGDAVALRAQAHKLKGSFGTIGAPTLATLCAHLETDAEKSALDQAKAQIDAIRHHYDLLAAEIDDYLGAVAR